MIVSIIINTLHIAAACVSLGSLAYARLVVLPNMKYISETEREIYLSKMIKQFAYIKWAAIIVLVLSGILQWFVSYPYVIQKNQYLLAFSFKMLGAVGLLCITFLLSLPKQTKDIMQHRRKFWTGIGLFFSLIILLGVAWMRQISKGLPCFFIALLVTLSSCKEQGANNDIPSHTSSNEDNNVVSIKQQHPESFGFGKIAEKERILLWDIDVRPDGQGLPIGSGTATKGKSIYNIKCVSCHGVEGKDGPYDRLVGPNIPWKEAKTIGNYWPYATTLFDYINRAMPFDQPGSLTASEVYSLTAYLLYENGIINEDEVLNSKTLPSIHMPNSKSFVDDDREGGKEIK